MSLKKELECKTILVGETGVGKTCLISRFANEEFNSEVEPTTSASYESKTLEFDDFNSSIEYQLWDTIGQEQYRGLAKIFYKDANIVILVYDITRKGSFDEMKDYWYKEVKDNSSEHISKYNIFLLYVFLKLLELLAIKMIYI